MKVYSTNNLTSEKRIQISSKGKLVLKNKNDLKIELKNNILWRKKWAFKYDANKWAALYSKRFLAASIKGYDH